MSDTHDSDIPRTPPSTEQLRIVGAEEAGTLVGLPEVVAEPDAAWAPSPARTPRRAVFESIPDAPADFDDVPLARAERWAGGTGTGPGSGRTDPDLAELDDAALAGLSEADDITVLGPARPSRSGLIASVPDAAELDDASQELELPHWTAPPTGQVPRVLVDENRKDDSWATYASAPRWRDDATSGWDDDLSVVSDLTDDSGPTAVPPARERPAIDQFFSFDDDESEPTPRRGSARAARRAHNERERERNNSTGEHRVGDVGGAPRGPVGSAPAAGRNVPVAAALGVGLAALAIALFRMGPGATMVFVLLLLAVGGAEFFDASRRGGYRPATLLGLAAVIGLPAATYWRGEVAFPVIGGLVMVAGLLWFLFGVDQEQVTADLGVTLLGVGYVGGLGSFAALILRTAGVDSTRVLLGAIVPVVANDVLGYVVGRNAGRSPLMPHVSPNKTVEGFLGGALGAVIASVAFNQLLGSNPWEGLGPALELGLLVAVMAPLGDLAESLIKRDLGIKDMGTILPGHGGVLDRFDALLFTLPGVYYLALLLGVLPH